MTAQHSLRDAIPADAAAIAAIYNHYVAATPVSMETDPVMPGEMAQRIAQVQDAALPWLVLEEDGRVLGYAYAGKWRARPGYRHAVESSVYLDAGERGRGLGAILYRALLARLHGRFHTVIGGIALPNAASIALHERLGFRQVACFPEVGHKFGAWIDVGYWQLTLP
ncbi:arsinothricin resistance N-acetyltransferase ArsN1 family B [Massilia sp. LXY-6]|uniref:arsinothricin resistance N-acetyltransferase ArsN1 family B n=1 Tax=Massilia sp. LXY-6 TaxID=3379823 RepID=UPI003EE195A0